MRLVYLDESYITLNTIKKMSFNKAYTNHTILKEDFLTKRIGVVMAV